VTDRASPDIEHLIAAAIESYVDNVHVSLPGIVVSYDSAKQTATVQPAIKRPVMNEDDQLVYEAYAPITNVPVEFPGSASLSFHWALAKGDSVVLLWQDFSFATWRKTGAVSEAGDTRKHGPSYPIARPWMRPSGGPGPDTDNSIGIPGGLRIHFTSGAVVVGNGSDFVAMAAKVDARLSALETFAGAHTHPVPGITPGPGATASSPAPGAPTGTSTASGNLKAD
jgi:hypothetical protein